MLNIICKENNLCRYLVLQNNSLIVTFDVDGEGIHLVNVFSLYNNADLFTLSL